MVPTSVHPAEHEDVVTAARHVLEFRQSQEPLQLPFIPKTSGTIKVNDMGINIIKIIKIIALLCVIPLFIIGRYLNNARIY